MGIDIQLYRLRIGIFGPGRGYTPKSGDKNTEYQTHIKGPDIHYRMFATLFLLSVIMKISEHVYQQINSMNYQIDFSILVGHEIYLCTGQIEFAQTYCRTGMFGTALFDYDSTYDLNNYSGFAQRLLLLSRDIESNPGPTDMDTILKAIQSSENKVLGEIRSVRSELASIKNDIATLKSDQIKTKLEINSMQQKQAGTANDVKNLQHDTQTLFSLKEQMQLDIDYLNEQIEQKEDTLNQLDKDIDRLEKYARADSLRIFGLPECTGESNENIREHVIRNVLKVACPSERWELDDIKKAYRVGKGTADGQPPVLLVRLRYDDDKSKIFEGRDLLRDKGIRVANDLTMRQRQLLKKLKDKGQTGYFYQGKLMIREAKQDLADPDRIIRQAYRRTQNSVPPDMRNVVNIAHNDENDISDASSNMSVERDLDSATTEVQKDSHT
ncbi:MAG: hypothetical protein AB2693_05020 [Candidatus Thiodiazotropha sp.]